MRPFLILLLVTLLANTYAQTANAKGIIETKRIAFGSSNAMVFNTSQANYSLAFERTFSTVPRIGLGVYTMDFEYSPTFNVKVTDSTTTSSAILQVITANAGKNNQLYLIYMATDHPYLGVFMPPSLITDQLNLRLQKNQQSFMFNYKQVMSTNSLVANIRVSVYLTGISTNSEMTNNGYSVNRTYFKMFATKLEMPFYNITVQVQSMFGDITISEVDYTIIYFDQALMNSTSTGMARYLMDAGIAQFNNFGGTSTPSSQAETLAPLPASKQYENGIIFYGISGLDCSRGPNIAISVYPTIYNSTDINKFVLNAETWKLTLVAFSSYDYVQYQSLKCNLAGSNCDTNCQNSPRPHFILNSICQYCQYSCLTCSSANSCVSCDASRTLSPISNLCECNSGYFDTFLNYTCQACFPCKTCSLSNQVCLTCRQDLHMIKNYVLSTCQCTIGYYPNYLNNTNNFDPVHPCLTCPQHCLVCANYSYCLACDLTTYLKQGKCFLVCTSNQAYESAACIAAANSHLFDQNGRLGYSWNYQTNQSVLNITLTFSQPDTYFYYYENGEGYSLANSQQAQAQAKNTQFYYDDGNGASSGFQSSSAVQVTPNVPIVALNVNSSAAGAITGSNQQAQKFDFSQVKISDINGSYLGISQQYYYYLAYYYYQQTSGYYAQYTDKYGIPYGKVKLSSSQTTTNPNFVDALANNLVLQVGNDTIPYQVQAASNNQFFLAATMPKSYYGETASLKLKNAGLVRSNNTASQLVSVSQPIYIYVCTTPSYVNSANSIYDSTKIIVQVLWGFGKYPLFIGFGWIMMPLMVVLQYIMSLNYIDTQRPLNLDLFLTSFSDFRNPSILYNPLRNDMDASIFTHKEIYVSIPAFNRFDRGIDFMRNCFQFFFVPFLAFLLYCLIVGFNKLLNKCKYDIPLISEYLQPRLPLLIGAYVLVQALPISFFFFAQLNDTTYRSAASSNSRYSVFNIAMSYLAFFLTCSIPILLIAYSYYKHTNKETKFKTGSQLIMVFNQILQSLPTSNSKASINDPLWTQNPDKTVSYGFAISIFYLAIFYGFFTSFFYNNYPWQLAGLVVITALFGFFAFRSSQFDSNIIKYFWVIFALLMLAFLLLLAAIGSNMSGAPCGQENLGYLGIGFIFALILASLVACAYLAWITIYSLYDYFCKSGPFIVNIDKKAQTIEQQPGRLKSMRDYTSKIKNSKSVYSQFNSKGAIDPLVVNGRYNVENPMTDDRLREVDQEEEAEDQINVRERLNFDRMDPQTGEYLFISDRTQTPYTFSSDQGRYLYTLPRIYIDKTGQIYDPEGRFVDKYKPLRNQIYVEAPKVQPQQQAVQQFKKSDTNNNVINIYSGGKPQQMVQEQEQKQEVRVINRYIYNGEQHEKIGEGKEGLVMMRNVRTGKVVMLSLDQFAPISQKQQEGEEENIVVVSRKGNDPTSIQQQVGAEISPQIRNNTIALDNNRKIKINDQEYMNIGEEGGLVRLYNTRNRKIQKIPKDDYILRYLDSFNYRVNLNGRDYDIFEEQHNPILVQTSNPSNTIAISYEELALLKQQNQEFFRNKINTQIITKTNASSRQVASNNYMIKRQEEPTKPVYEAPLHPPPVSNLLLLQSKATKSQQFKEGSVKQIEPISITSNKYVSYQQEVGSTNNKRTSEQSITEYRATIHQSSNRPSIQMQRYSPTNQPEQVIIKQMSSHTDDGPFIKKQSVQMKRQVIQTVEHEEELDPDTIEYILKKSPGPFQMYVMDADKVYEENDQDHYDKNQARERKIILGNDVMDYMKKMERLYHGCIIFMVDMNSKEEYRIN